MFKYKIISDGPYRRWRSSAFPEQQIIQLQGKDIVNGMDLPAFEMEAVGTESAFDWFDTAAKQTLESTEEAG